MSVETISINKFTFVSGVAKLQTSAAAITTQKAKMTSYEGSSTVIYRYLRLYNDMEQAMKLYQNLLIGDANNLKTMQSTFSNMDTAIQKLWE